MLQIRLNDVVIVPKMPADTAFSVACVSEFEPGISYGFDPPNWMAPCDDAMPCPKGHCDFGHIVSVDPNSVATYPKEHNEYTGIIADIIKGAPYMAAVNIANNHGKKRWKEILNAALAELGFECPS